MATFRLPSFAKGEVSEKLYGRIDTSLYQISLKTLRNFFGERSGAVSNRPGTVYCDETRTPAKRVKLIKFTFNSTTANSYVMEFGNLYVEFLQAGGRVVESAKNIAGITQANPAVITLTAHGYSNGDDVYVTGVLGMLQVNNRRFRVSGAAANSFSITDTSGTNVNSTGYTAWSSGGTCQRIYSVTTPYVEADLQSLSTAQQADVVNIAHRNYAPRSLTRASHTSWTLATLTFAPTPTGPAAGAASSITAGSNTYRYRVTTFAAGQESLPGLEATKNIASVSQANPGSVTVTAHGYTTGDEIYITGIVGMTELNGNTYTITSTGANTFTIGVNTTGYGAYVSGGTVARTFIAAYSAAAPTVADPHTLTWNVVANAEEYFVYRESNGVYGYIGAANPVAAGATTASFNDTGIVPDTADSPPSANNPFTSANNYPGVVAFYQGRLLWASTNNFPARIWASRSGDYYNLTHSFPLLDDDGFDFVLNSNEVETINALIDTGKLMIMTSGGEWAALGDGAGILRPGDVNAKKYGYDGSSTVFPIIVAGQVVYIQARGSIIRNLAFEFSTDSYQGEDLTLTASHLVDGYTVGDLAAQQNPNSIVWGARSDGTLIAFTYVPKQQMLCWHHHDTSGGTFENVCVVPEGTEDSLYVVVKRTINSRTVRYVERITSRYVSNIKTAVFMDCNGVYDGRNTGSGTMTVTGSSYATTSIVTIIASAASTFVAGDVGSAIHITAADGIDYRLVISAFTNGTTVLASPHKAMPADIQAVATTSWAFARKVITGLSFLEGKTVSVLGDGFVEGDPNDSSYTAITVSGGSITLSRPYGVVEVGLPILADVQTLNIDSMQMDVQIDKMKIINKVTAFVASSRGLWAGTVPPASDTTGPITGLQRMIAKNAVTADSPEALSTDPQWVNTNAAWNYNGRVFLRQTAPLPVTILEIAPAGYIGGR